MVRVPHKNLIFAALFKDPATYISELLLSFMSGAVFSQSLFVPPPPTDLVVMRGCLREETKGKDEKCENVISRLINVVPPTG
jgi:hypothetical protein